MLTFHSIEYAYRPKGRTLWTKQNGGGDDPRNVRKRWQDEKDDDINKDIGRILISANETVRTDAFLDTTLSLEKIKVSTEKTKLEEMLVVSVPKRYGFNKPGTIAALKGKFYFDELEGNGQTIYALEYGWYKNKVILHYYVPQTRLHTADAYVSRNSRAPSLKNCGQVPCPWLDRRNPSGGGLMAHVSQLKS